MKSVVVFLHQKTNSRTISNGDFPKEGNQCLNKERKFSPAPFPENTGDRPHHSFVGCAGQTGKKAVPFRHAEWDCLLMRFTEAIPPANNSNIQKRLSQLVLDECFHLGLVGLNALEELELCL